jgi:hypothetical protein
LISSTLLSRVVTPVVYKLIPPKVKEFSWMAQAGCLRQFGEEHQQRLDYLLH